jgi:molecular chaperone HscB
VSCSHPQTIPFTICPRCESLVVPREEVDYFEIFGIKPRYGIDKNHLQSRFYQISRNLHPDRFHSKSEEALSQATHWFAVLNQAFTTLNSDSDRAQYLFDLAGFKPQNSKNTLPPDLAEDYFTLQESMEDDSMPAAEKTQQAKKFAGKIDEEIARSNADRDAAMADWEKSGAPLDQNAFPFFERAARELNQSSYLSSMAEDLEKKCRM